METDVSTEASTHPTWQVTFWIGGYPHEGYSVELEHDGVLRVRRGAEDGPILTERRPHVADWKVFWAVVDRARVWEWDFEYLPQEEVLDGTSWRLRICRGLQFVESSGSNAFPFCTDSGVPDGSPFDLLVSALQVLTGSYDLR